MIKYVKATGFTLITAVILLVSVTILLTALFFMFTASSRASINSLTAAQAQYVAEAGLEIALQRFNSSDLSDRLSCINVATVNNDPSASLPGTYSLITQSAFSTVPATLSSSISSSASIIPISSSGAYNSDGGRVLIDREAIDYASISQSNVICGNAPCLVGAIRGADGTIARSHSSGTRVGQYQCVIRSTGTVPMVGLDSQQHVLTAVQQYYYVAVGDRDNGPYITKWQDNVWTRVSTSGLPSQNLLSVDMLSYVDGWAVGRRSNSTLNIQRWNGNQWSRVFPVQNINRHLSAVKCVDGQDCWAVGDDYQNNLLFVRWDGSNWNRFNANNLSLREDLYGLDCVASDDCWAVGSSVDVEECDDDDDDDCGDFPGITVDDMPLLVHWNGSQWQQAMVNIQIRSSLRAVHCVVSNDCWAVGDRNTGGNNGPVILHYNGSSWTQASLPGSLPSDTNFYSVTCTASNNCWAVGGERSPRRAIVLRYNGTSWSNMTLNNSVPNRYLRDVDCLTADNCWIVGDDQGGDPLYLHWDGTSLDRVDGSQVSGSKDLLSISLIGPRTHSTGAWQNDFY